MILFEHPFYSSFAQMAWFRCPTGIIFCKKLNKKTKNVCIYIKEFKASVVMIKSILFEGTVTPEYKCYPSVCNELVEPC